MHVFEEVVRIDCILAHQPGQRRAVISKMLLLDAFGFSRFDAEQALDIGPHPLVDQREQAGGGGIEAVVEIEDPGFNPIERRPDADGGGICHKGAATVL